MLEDNADKQDFFTPLSSRYSGLFNSFLLFRKHLIYANSNYMFSCFSESPWKIMEMSSNFFLTSTILEVLAIQRINLIYSPNKWLMPTVGWNYIEAPSLSASTWKIMEMSSNFSFTHLHYLPGTCEYLSYLKILEMSGYFLLHHLPSACKCEEWACIF